MRLAPFVQFTLLTLSFTACAAIPRQSVAQTNQGNLDLLRAELASTATFPREITVFHYAPRTDLGLAPTGAIDSSSPAVQSLAYAYRLSAIAAYDRLDLPITGRDAKGTPMGPNGMYVAIDPAVSRRWGDANWSMQAMRMQKNARYFDGRIERPFAPIVQAYLGELNCGATSPRLLIRSDAPGCRKGLQAITRATGAKAIAYFFMWNLLPACKAVAGPYATAFVLIDAAAIDQGNVGVFAREAPSPDSLAQERQYVFDFFNLTGRGVSDFPGMRPSADLGPLNAWAKDNLYRCNASIAE